MPGAGNPQALNRYSYCYNNPIRLVDPDGHDGGVIAATIAVATNPWVILAVGAVGTTWVLVHYEIDPNAAQHRRDLALNILYVSDTAGTAVANAKEAIVDAGETVGQAIWQGTTHPAPTAGISVYEQRYLPLHTPKGNKWRQKAQPATNPPQKDPTQEPPPQKPGGWRNIPVTKTAIGVGVGIGAIGAALKYLGQCEPYSQQPGVLKVVEPTPSSPPWQWQSPSPRGIPEGW